MTYPPNLVLTIVVTRAQLQHDGKPVFQKFSIQSYGKILIF